jgi:hypothetical protein
VGERGPVWRGDTGPEGELPAWVGYVLGDEPGPTPAGPADEPPPPGDPTAAPAAQPGRPPAGRRRGPGALLAAVLVLAGIVTAVVVTNRSPSPDAASPPPAPAIPWEIGACVRQTGGPTKYPPEADDWERRRLYDMLSKSYSTVSCSDPAAEGRITARGATFRPTERRRDDKCPANTDYAYSVSDRFRLSFQIWCARALKPPHPGDPGGGNGRLLTGDCVTVASTGGRYHNDRIREVPCTERFYAKIVAQVRQASRCPGQTLSRLARPDAPATILCLAQAGKGLIARPGQCVEGGSSRYAILTRASCARPLRYRLVAIVATESRCPPPTSPFEVTGYDRYVCLRSPGES